jgi:hypothetical protein
MVHIGLMGHDDTAAAVSSDQEFLKEWIPILMLLFLYGFTILMPCCLEIAEDFPTCIAPDREHNFFFFCAHLDRKSFFFSKMKSKSLVKFF